MSVFRCQHCRSYVQWMSTKFNGKRLLFDCTPVPIETDYAGEGWIPGGWVVGSTKRTVMAPIDHYGRDKRARVRHVVLKHSCSTGAVVAHRESA